MLAGLREVLDPAVAAGAGVGAFNVICLEHAEALIWGAEAARLPVVLQVSENAVLYHRSLEPILTATVALARNADVPAVVHLDHVTDPDLARAGVELGATSVMFDGSRRPYDENVAVTADVVRHCHRHGIQVEAELGEVGGKDGVHAATARTKPDEAVAFVTDTGVDALAVAVGSSHAQTERTTRLDLDLVAQLKEAIEVPLVLHGSSGVPDDELVRAVHAGLTKINIGTHLNAILTRSVRHTLADQPRQVDPRKYLGPARDDVADEIERLLKLLARPASPV
jgi:fructose-bisphosphate aldolase, class II